MANWKCPYCPNVPDWPTICAPVRAVGTGPRHRHHRPPVRPDSAHHYHRHQPHPHAAHVVALASPHHRRHALRTAVVRAPPPHRRLRRCRRLAAAVAAASPPTLAAPVMHPQWSMPTQQRPPNLRPEWSPAQHRHCRSSPPHRSRAPAATIPRQSTSASSPPPSGCDANVSTSATIPRHP